MKQKFKQMMRKLAAYQRSTQQDDPTHDVNPAFTVKVLHVTTSDARFRVHLDSDSNIF